VRRSASFLPHSHRIPARPRQRGLEAFLSNIRIGFFGAAMLVLLRMTVGWHILYEGIWKYQQQDFSADGYLSMASGPFADYYRTEVMEDFEGRKHLDEKWNLDKLQSYYDRFLAQMKLDDAAKTEAAKHLEERKQNIKDFLAEKTNAMLFGDYAVQWEGIKKQKAELDKSGGGTSFQSERIWKAEQSLRREGRPWVDWIDNQHDALRDDLNQLLPMERRGSPLRPSIQEIFTDKNLFVTYSSIAIGVCMIVGLLSRLASLGGAILLVNIVAAKWDWPRHYSPPAHPAQGHSLFITKEFIEMMCCFTLATLPTGRWAGFDYFLHGLFVRPFMRNKD